MCRDAACRVSAPHCGVEWGRRSKLRLYDDFFFNSSISRSALALGSAARTLQA